MKIVVYSFCTMLLKIPFRQSFRNPLLSLPGTFRYSVFLANWYHLGRESDQENTQGKVEVGEPVCGASRASGLGKQRPWAIAHQRLFFSFSLLDMTTLLV